MLRLEKDCECYMGKLQKINKYVDKIAGSMIVVLFSVMIISCVLQVFTRFVLNDSLSWTEELSRYTFIWANLLGAAFCVRNNKHAQVTVIFDALPSKLRKYFTLIIQLLIITVASVMVVQGLKVAQITQAQFSPSLNIHISLIYLALPVSGLLIIIYSLINIITEVKDIPEKGEKA